MRFKVWIVIYFNKRCTSYLINENIEYTLFIINIFVISLIAYTRTFQQNQIKYLFP